MNETCSIFSEDTDVGQFFSVDGCLHRYCFTCMEKHVETKLLHDMVPKCPHESRNSELKFQSCRKFLTPRLTEIMIHRMNEASIPVTGKVYCPYPKCSALTSKGAVLEYSRITAVVADARTGVRKCTKCQCLFCINCKVPWHDSMSCIEYKRKYPYPIAEDAMLKILADRNLWRQCIMCNHMIELSDGCDHMTCRCVHEFCYTCGAEWTNQSPTCDCSEDNDIVVEWIN